MIEWLLAFAIVLAVVAALPGLLRRAKRKRRKAGGGSGAMIAIGIAFSMIFDAKASQAMETIDRKTDIGDSDEGESGAPPA